MGNVSTVWFNKFNLCFFGSKRHWWDWRIDQTALQKHTHTTYRCSTVVVMGMHWDRYFSRVHGTRTTSPIWRKSFTNKKTRLLKSSIRVCFSNNKRNENGIYTAIISHTLSIDSIHEFLCDYKVVQYKNSNVERTSTWIRNEWPQTACPMLTWIVHNRSKSTIATELAQHKSDVENLSFHWNERAKSQQRMAMTINKREA